MKFEKVVLRVIVGDKKVVAFKRAREARWPPLRLVEPVNKLLVEAPKPKVTIPMGCDLDVDR
jgi:hypothetical protein